MKEIPGLAGPVGIPAPYAAFVIVKVELIPSAQEIHDVLRLFGEDYAGLPMRKPEKKLLIPLKTEFFENALLYYAYVRNSYGRVAVYIRRQSH